ncbi:hypothetical protein THAOC_20119, partial [Thalassiosira oceanica]
MGGASFKPGDSHGFMQAVRLLSATPVPVPAPSPFKFEMSAEAAEHNTAVLETFDNDLGKAIDGSPGTHISYGSEVRDNDSDLFERIDGVSAPNEHSVDVEDHGDRVLECVSGEDSDLFERTETARDQIESQTTASTGPWEQAAKAAAPGPLPPSNLSLHCTYISSSVINFPPAPHLLLQV